MQGIIWIEVHEKSPDTRQYYVHINEILMNPCQTDLQNLSENEDNLNQISHEQSSETINYNSTNTAAFEIFLWPLGVTWLKVGLTVYSNGVFISSHDSSDTLK